MEGKASISCVGHLPIRGSCLAASSALWGAQFGFVTGLLAQGRPNVMATSKNLAMDNVCMEIQKRPLAAITPSQCHMKQPCEQGD